MHTLVQECLTEGFDANHLLVTCHGHVSMYTLYMHIILTPNNADQNKIRGWLMT